ncbi:MAG: DUF4783 domain-containing protein [Saprospiraceae bacterium]|nr:DUF4783 domain-containing protein [Saprospiraceae bacterium]
MNRLILLLFTCLLTIPVLGQSDVYNALSKGDVDAIANHLDNNVELCIFDQEDIFTRQKAISMLRDFFAQHAPKGFKQMHSGASKGRDANYAIGQLSTGTGTYRVYLYFDTRNDKQVIKELRIEHNR